MKKLIKLLGEAISYAMISLIGVLLIICAWGYFI